MRRLVAVLRGLDSSSTTALVVDYTAMDLSCDKFSSMEPII